MAAEKELTGLARRERTGSEKRRVGLEQIARMLPKSEMLRNRDRIAEDVFAPELLLMGMEDSYCDMWSRTEVIDSRIRSIATVSMMIGVGNVGNQFELGYHAPGAVYNGVTLEELAAVLEHSRVYVGSPASAWARQSMVAALKAHGLLEGPQRGADLERRERTGSQKRAIAREVLNDIEPGSPLLDVKEEIPTDVFAPELDFMILENSYCSLWGQTDVLDRRIRSIVTVGILIGLANHPALRAHIPVALRNGVTVPEFEEMVYQASTYLGYPAGTAVRATIAAGIDDAQELSPGTARIRGAEGEAAHN